MANISDSIPSKTLFTYHPFFSVQQGKKQREPNVDRSPLGRLVGGTLMDISRVAGGGATHMRHSSWSVESSAGSSSVFPSIRPRFGNAASKKGLSTLPYERRFSVMDVPLPAAEALMKYRKYVSDWEAREVAGFAQVYFLGLRAEKVKPDAKKPNCGFDDEHSNYLTPLNDHLAYRFEILSFLGKGAYGKVIRCYDHLTHSHVAIKIIRNLRSAQKLAEEEVKILETVRGVTGVVELKESFRFREHTCLVFEELDVSLHAYLRLGLLLPLPLVRSILEQLLLTISELHHRSIIHCDIKPDNILFRDRTRTSIKLIDFGTAVTEHNQILGYAQTRFYRAPEVLLGIKAGHLVDMWSIGCVAAEMFSGRPLFAGENECDQLRLISEALGAPPLDLLAKAGKAGSLFDPSGRVKQPVGVSRKPAVPLCQLLSSLPVSLYDFIEQCLQWSPSSRLQPEAALRHPFILSSKS
jgi:dual specificity tyrosine-phosphorylation-regulated kinase 2/3/4